MVTKCITRSGWLVELCPILFLVFTIGIIIYGLLFKRFDGYHDDGLEPRTVPREPIPARYDTFANLPPRYPPGRRRQSLLPPVLEDEE